MKDILYFDAMLTPKIITAVYWLMLIGAVLGGLGTIIGGSGVERLLGLGMLIGGTIVARIWCELLIVLFKIHENIHKLTLKESNPAGQNPNPTAV